MEKVVLFYNEWAEPVGYELLDIDTDELSKNQIKKMVEGIMRDKYQLKWEEYEKCIYLLDTSHLKRL